MVYGIGVEYNIVEMLDQQEKIAQLYMAIDQLTPKQKRRIVDHYINEMKLREIAEKERVSIRAIQSSLSGALMKLRRILGKRL